MKKEYEEDTKMSMSMNMKDINPEELNNVEAAPGSSQADAKSTKSAESWPECVNWAGPMKPVPT